MLTYELKKAPGVPLYEALYRCIRGDILSGALAPGDRLPSKRALAEHLEISKVTVEGAYDQLLAEGYIRSREKVGYFVEPVAPVPAAPAPAPSEPQARPDWTVDLTANRPAPGFPFSVWSKLQRQVMLDYGDRLLEPMPNQGILPLRQAIAQHLAQFRNMRVDPRNILVGAGTDFLYNLLLQLLGREGCYGVEEPGYQKIRQIYEAGGVTCVPVPMDAQGVDPARLGRVRVLHISPSHHFPTGIVTPAGRRSQLLQWAAQGRERWLIEDDYDSEFRFDAHPVPTLQAMDRWGRVIYINTFSKTLAPSIRVSYMVLPEALMERFRQKLGFYSCTVASFEQHTLARFIRQGYFEKHLNRMRRFYRARRNRVIAMLRGASFADRVDILEQDAGLHFIARIHNSPGDEKLKRLCADAGIRIACLGDFYRGPVPRRDRGCLVVNYSGIDESRLAQALEALENRLQ